MKVQYYSSLQCVNQKSINKCKQGKWHHWKRTFIIESKTDQQIAILSLNLFERFSCFLQKIFCSNYFSQFFRGHKVRILNSFDIEPLSKKSSLEIKSEKKIQSIAYGKEIVVSDEAKTSHFKILLKQKTDYSSKQLNSSSESISADNLENEAFSLPVSCLSAREQEERLKRILNQGIFENDSIDILKFEKILPNFEKFKLNHERQRSLGNFDSTVVFLDYTTEFGLNDVELRRFIRYLVMNDKIYCFSERFNFGILAHLFIYDPGRVHLASEEQPLQTKNTLLQNDERLMDLQYPKISDFLPEEQAEMETILRLLKIIHYKRRIFNAPKYSITHHIDHDVTHSMDQLVRLGVIYAWSFYSDLRQLSIKLTDEDVLPEFSSHFSLWRDRELIEKEEAFKRANQIILRETDENEIRKKLNEEQQQSLTKLLNELNSRIKQGVFRCSRDEYPEVVIEELGKRGYFISYGICGHNGDELLIYVNEGDVS